MVGISSAFNARFAGQYALQLLQTSATNNGGSGKQPGVSAQIGVTPAGETGGAVDSIMRIIMDAKGNATVKINSPDSADPVKTGRGNDVVDIKANDVTKVSTGRGNDTITIQAEGRNDEDIFDPSVQNIRSGKGDDTISITTGGNVYRVEAGRGDDQISIETTAPVTGPLGAIENISKGIGYAYGGKGDDTIALKSSTTVMNISGDGGNDTIDITAAAFSFNTDGGDGDDVISVVSRNAGNVDGGNGNDVISVSGLNATNINGGDGNDIIFVNATAAALNIAGGRGDDYVFINSTSAVQSSYRFAKGDGHDIIETNNPLEITRFSSDGTEPADMANAVIERQGNTLQISFNDSSDTITLNLTGRMAEADKLHLAYKSGTQSLVIADDQFFIDNPPGQTVFVRPEAAKEIF